MAIAPLLASGASAADRAHVVEPVGELDQQHADVARHRHDHLADVLGLLLLARLELEYFSSFVSPSTIRRHLVAELVARCRRRVTSVSSTVSCSSAAIEGRRVQAQVGEDLGHGERMLDEVLSRLALLALVRVLGERDTPAAAPSGRPSGCRSRTFFRSGSIGEGGPASPRRRRGRGSRAPRRCDGCSS